MLVLTRKLMEKLFIGDDICVTVVRLEGGPGAAGDRRSARGLRRPRRAGPRTPAPRLRIGPPTASPARERPDVRHSPSEARGTDSRRRGRFR